MSRKHLPDTIEEMKRFNARRKLKVGVLTIDCSCLTLVVKVKLVAIKRSLPRYS